MSFNEFDQRMKEIEHLNRNKVVGKDPYFIVRLDGKAFHTYTKSFKDKNAPDPFSSVLHSAFMDGCRYLAENVDGCLAVYTQSDEVSLLLKGYPPEGDLRTPWFDSNTQKITSVTASMLTAVFNNSIIKHSTSPSNFPLDFAFFDSRVFGIPEKEINNYFWWRQSDAIRNSITMVAQHYFSHKELHGVDSEKKIAMLKQKGVDWEAMETWKKQGSLLVKDCFYTDATWIDKKGQKHVEKHVMRSQWEEVPNLEKFLEHPVIAYIEHYLNPES